MQVISRQEFNTLVEGTKILSYGRVDQPKVFEKNDTTIIKLFYWKKKLITSDKIRPRVTRFCRNLDALRKLGYAVPMVDKLQTCPDLKFSLVQYEKVPGQDIRRLAQAGDVEVIAKVADFLANLHENGVFFRSIHLENLLLQPDYKTFGVIDVTDIQFSGCSLSLYNRYRNLRHLLKEINDRKLWQAFGAERFLTLYFAAAKLSPFKEKVLSSLIKRYLANPQLGLLTTK